MKEIIKYKAIDGVEFADAIKCRDYEALISREFGQQYYKDCPDKADLFEVIV